MWLSRVGQCRKLAWTARSYATSASLRATSAAPSAGPHRRAKKRTDQAMWPSTLPVARAPPALLLVPGRSLSLSARFASAVATSSPVDKVAQVAASATEIKEAVVVKNATGSPAAGGASPAATVVESPSQSQQELVLDFIPEKPAPLDSLAGSDLAEPTLESLGLASWWPPGRMQYVLESIHTSWDVPWWGSIMIVTASLRILMFPLVVMAQKNAAKLANHSPEMQVLQAKMTDARRRGDQLETAQVTMELQKFMKSKNINPLKNVVPLFLQMPVFMSMFFALRGMSYLPVDSMMAGGLFWFSDLTLKDPYYLLPLSCSASLYLQFKFAADGANLEQAGPIMKGVMKFMPVALFPLTMSFPAAITFYWLTTNVISVAQAKMVRSSLVRRRLGIPEIIKHDLSKLPIKKKGFREAVRESIDNWKTSADIADRRAFDEAAFREAGMEKAPRTYKYDPTKPLIRAKKTYR